MRSHRSGRARFLLGDHGTTRATIRIRLPLLLTVLILSAVVPVSCATKKLGHRGPPASSMMARASSSSSLSPRRRKEQQQHTQQQQQQQQQEDNNKSNDTGSCPIFLWNPVSYVRSHLCRRLVRDQVYEGLGGKKFVRIKPDSLLSALYPCSQHKTDGCLVCGHTWHDHLHDWWGRRRPARHAPCDDHVDAVYDRCTVLEEEPPPSRSDGDAPPSGRRPCYENVASFAFTSQFVVVDDDGTPASLALSLLQAVSYFRLQQLVVIENVENRRLLPQWRRRRGRHKKGCC